MWQAGLYDRFPAVIDHTIIAVALNTTGGSTRLGIPMDDVSESLLPDGDVVVASETHDGFVGHMVQLHAEESTALFAGVRRRSHTSVTCGNVPRLLTLVEGVPVPGADYLRTALPCWPAAVLVAELLRRLIEQGGSGCPPTK